MIIEAKAFTPAPEGVHAAVCVDVADLGMVTGQFGTKHTLKVVWEIEAKMDDGKPFTVSKRYTATLNEKGNLAKDLKSWRGKPFTPEELKGFDTEKLINVPCQVVVQHNERDGQVYGNVTTVIKAQGVKLAPTGKYVRHKDREDQRKPVQHPDAAEEADERHEALCAHGVCRGSRHYDEIGVLRRIGLRRSVDLEQRVPRDAQVNRGEVSEVGQLGDDP